MCMKCLQKPEEGIGSPWDCSYRWLWALMWVLGTKPLCLQEQRVPLTTEPPLQPPSLAPLRGDFRYSFICGSRTWKKVLWIRPSMMRGRCWGWTCLSVLCTRVCLGGCEHSACRQMSLNRAYPEHQSEWTPACVRESKENILKHRMSPCKDPDGRSFGRSVKMYVTRNILQIAGSTENEFNSIKGQATFELWIAAFFSVLGLFINIYYQSDGCDKGELSVSRDFLDLIFAFFSHKDGENIKQPLSVPSFYPWVAGLTSCVPSVNTGVDFGWSSVWQKCQRLDGFCHLLFSVAGVRDGHRQLRGSFSSRWFRCSHICPENNLYPSIASASTLFSLSGIC